MARILVAMSGGVDSAVAAALLHEQGHEVIGVTMRLYTEADDAALRSGRTCCGIEDVGDARAAAQRIGIPHYVLNMEHEFERDVIDPFVRAYAAGETPNPCLECNRRVKFSVLLDRALAMGVDAIATGHYARVVEYEGASRLYDAVDAEKDQSYVLYTLTQEALRRIYFPLGGMTKAETREHARRFSLPLAEKPDSVDICFVPGGDYRAFVASRGVTGTPGTIERPDGTPVGTHLGIPQYTVGQRRGVGVNGPARQFVTRLDVARNVVVVGAEDDLLAGRASARQPSWVVAPPEAGESLRARIRYHAQAVPVTVADVTPDGFTVVFETPARAVSPGQAIVLYRDTGHGAEVVGGGTLVARHQ